MSEAEAWADAGERISLKNFAKRQVVEAATGLVGGAVLKHGGRALWKVARRAYYARAGPNAVGQVGERALRRLPGVSQKPFSTPIGTRKVDRLYRGVAHEAKTGRAGMDPLVRKQIAKDFHLMKAGKVQGVTWDFYRSPATGQRGPTKGLEKALRTAGIKIQMHPGAW
jgi:hypothetical protein